MRAPNTTSTSRPTRPAAHLVLRAVVGGTVRLRTLLVLLVLAARGASRLDDDDDDCVGGMLCFLVPFTRIRVAANVMKHKDVSCMDVTS